MVTFNLSPELRKRIDAKAGKHQGPTSRDLATDTLGPAPPEDPDQPILHQEGTHFETDKEARQEDTRRAARLVWVRPLDRPMSWTNMAAKLRLAKQRVQHLQPLTLDPRAMDAFAARLDAVLAGSTSSSLGSAKTMRIVRETVLGALHAAFEDFPDEALATVTVINRRWTFSPMTFDSITAKKLKNRFRTDLNRIGALKMRGPFIAFLHGEFEPASGLYVLHFHILTTREKAEALRGLKRLKGYQPTDSGAAPVVCKPVRARLRQFSYLLKSYWPARTIRRIDGATKRDRGHHRIPEPFGSQVLLWLDRQRLRDLTIMNDCWSMRNGGTEAMKRLYLSVFGAW
ncbi:hypothetical protein [Methylobacterium fujisawaense]|uniref:hypothetical protein n=1 Tax=Methylobacterium fujisawaense TaxID=107400 RepID=UPI0036F8F964